jgi:hypothetical protein
MSSHADTIRQILNAPQMTGAAYLTGAMSHAGHKALDALLAENQQLREALHRHLLNDALQNQYHYEAAVEFADKGLTRALAAVVEECVCGEINTRHCPVHGQGAVVEE